MDATIRNAVMAIDRLGDAVTSGAERKRNDLQAAPCYEHGNQQLTGEFEHPVKVPKSSAMPSRLIMMAPGENHPRLMRLGEQSFDERNAGCEQHGHGEADDMPEPPSRGVGMVCTSRARTSPTAPISMAIWRINGVIK